MGGGGREELLTGLDKLRDGQTTCLARIMTMIMHISWHFRYVDYAKLESFITSAKRTYLKILLTVEFMDSSMEMVSR